MNTQLALQIRRLAYCLTVCAAASGMGRFADAEVVQTPVFVSGEGGYHTYRIPAAIVTPQGTLLAFCEGRKSGRGDAGNIDLLLRRSFDGGQTWQPTQLVWDDGPHTCGNSCPVIDRESGTIWLLLTHNLGHDAESAIISGRSEGTRTVWVTKSDDEGATWDTPVEITGDVKQPEWTWYATGPGIGIQLSDGRLVIPCDHKADGGKLRQSHIIYSDDRGSSWKLGGAAGPGCNESQVVELPDGRLLLNMRSYQGNNRRRISTSEDRGLTWSAPEDDATLIEPVCQASLIRLAEKDVLLFSNPASMKREKMTVRLSRDGGETWPIARVLHAGPAAYSCLAELPDGTLGCLFERGDSSPYETITWSRFTPAWLAGNSR